jgi:hypothetical protein
MAYRLGLNVAKRWYEANICATLAPLFKRLLMSSLLMSSNALTSEMQLIHLQRVLTDTPACTALLKPTLATVHPVIAIKCGWQFIEAIKSPFVYRQSLQQIFNIDDFNCTSERLDTLTATRIKFPFL